MLTFAIAPYSISVSTADAKQRLKGTFGSGAAVELLACPSTKSVLRYEQSVLGGQTRRCLTSAETGARYPAAGEYYDLLPSASTTIDLGGLATELRDALQVDMQTQFFRTPAMAFLYERGWRQNFNAAGFPGIDREFAEAAEFFGPCAAAGSDSSPRQRHRAAAEPAAYPTARGALALAHGGPLAPRAEPNPRLEPRVAAERVGWPHRLPTLTRCRRRGGG